MAETHSVCLSRAPFSDEVLMDCESIPDPASLSSSQEDELLKDDDHRDRTSNDLAEKLSQVKLTTTVLPVPTSSPAESNVQAPANKDVKITYRVCRNRKNRRAQRIRRRPTAKTNVNVKIDLSCKPPELLSLKISPPFLKPTPRKMPKSRLFRTLEPDGSWVVVCFKCREKGHMKYNCPY